MEANTKLLVVDDSKEDLELYKMIFDELEVVIDVASSGEEAIELCESNEYSAAIMDYYMPGINGPECVVKIRSVDKHHSLPVLFVSGNEKSRENIRQAYSSGAIDFLSKPINEEELTLKIGNILNSHLSGIKKKSYLNKDWGLEEVLEQVGEGVVVFNHDFHVIFANKAASTLLTESVDSIVGRHISEYIFPELESHEWQKSDFACVFKDGQCHQKDEAYFWRRKESRFPVQYTQSTILYDGQSVGILFFHDDTERLMIKSELARMANYDHLTGVANRSLFMSNMDKLLASSNRYGFNFAILVIDLDNFKYINDSYGHMVGDEALQYVCKSVKNIIREDDLFSRIGGDEFALVVSNITNGFSPAVVAEKIISGIKCFTSSNGEVVEVECSIGIALNTQDCSSAEDILKNADAAMYKAKRRGKGCYEFYSKEMQKAIAQRRKLIHKMKEALADQIFDVFFQPQVNLKDNSLFGLEALIRWYDRDRGFVNPSLFIPLAEEVGLINEIDLWCIDEVCARFSFLRDKYVLSNDFSVSLNVSASQLNDTTLFDKITSAIDKYKLPRGSIHVEVTETAVMHDVSISTATLKKFRDSGIGVSIDDFGTGYSSLGYLKTLPFDVLKIDQSFVKDIGFDSNNEAIIDAIIQLAKSLELVVVAEGVETETQADFLSARGCEYAQGYLFGKPLNMTQLEQYLENEAGYATKASFSSVDVKKTPLSNIYQIEK